MRGDQIARIVPAGMLRQAAARERIDASNLVVAPGFIDIQRASGLPQHRCHSRASEAHKGIATTLQTPDLGTADDCTTPGEPV